MLKLIYKDSKLAVFDKPAGLLVHRGWDNDRVTALDLARAEVGHVYPVHRLDRATSGVLLFALDRETAAAIHAQFESASTDSDGAVGTPRITKRYLALVRGTPPERGVVDHPIPRREGGPRVEACTRFRTLHSIGWYSLVEAFPLTGRLHQVRRHMKHLSHPLIGDVKYGRGEHNRLFRESFGLHRLALHASSLSLVHEGEARRFTAPLPDDLNVPFEKLGIPGTAWRND